VLHRVTLNIPKIKTIDLELDDELAPKTVTPIGKKGEFKPYSPVNVIGKIKNTDKKFLKNVPDGIMVTFSFSK
jgi:hypothetical protein